MGTNMNVCNRSKVRSILVVEDDPRQVQSLTDAIAQAFPGCEIVVRNTESQLYEFVDSGPFDNCAVVVLDVMLPWAKPSPRIPSPPPSVIKEGIFWAGRRCIRKIRERDPNKPIIVYSARDPSLAGITDEKEISILQKQVAIDPVIEKLRAILDRM